ncbi:hypothetical protein ACHWQZ_G000511 [Mnemiopsis leidyi]
METSKTEKKLPAELEQTQTTENNDKWDLEQRPTDNRDKMKKNITVLRGIALVVGTVIGTGIFITPNSITRRVEAPATSILVWAAGGVMAAVGGLVCCELGTMIPVSGAEVAYLRKIYGPLPGFLSVWLLHFLLGGMRRAIGVLGFSKYFWSLFYENPDAEVNWWVSKLVALSVFYVIVALVTLKPTLILQCIVFFTSSKFVATIIIIVAGFIYLGKGNTDNISVGFTGTNTDAKNWGDAWNGVIWSYLGWEQICIVTSEIRNPQRNIPIIVISSVAIVTVLYLLTVVSYHVVIPLEIMKQDRAVASEFGFRTMGEAGKIILALTVVLSTLGNIQCTFLTQSRYIHSGSVEGLLPSCFGLVSRKYKTPIISILYLTGVTSVFVVIGGIDGLISTAGFTIFPFYVACSVGVFVMRRTHPDLPRPYRVPLVFPALFVLFGLFVFITPFLGEDWLISLIWVLVLLLGIPLYYLILKNVFRFEFLKKWDKAVTALLARILDCD